MKFVDANGWIAVTICVMAYLLGTPHQFDLANAFLCVPVAGPALLRRAWPSAAISLTFGVFGALHLLGIAT